MKTIIIVIAVMMVLASGVHAGSLTNCERATVQAALNSATDGEIIICPAGSFSWGTTPVTISGKTVTLRGNGPGSTAITMSNNDGNTSPISISVPANKLVKITGFKFSATGSYGGSTGEGQMINISGDGRYRIYNNVFLIERRGIDIWATKGLIDNNIFNKSLANGGTQAISINGNTATCCGDSRSGSWEWQYPAQLGSEYAVFIENNTFNWTNAGDSAIDAYNGARFVFRHNTVNGKNIGVHGNDSGGQRSPLSYEIYNNTINATGIYVAMNFRGGSGVIYNNTTYANNFAWLQNYRSCPGVYGVMGAGTCDGSNQRDGNENSTGWPCQDQIGRTGGVLSGTSQPSLPMFFWENTFNGGSANPDTGACQAEYDHIKINRDYFVASSIADARSKGLVYTAYPYPHPLTGGTDPPQKIPYYPSKIIVQ